MADDIKLVFNAVDNATNTVDKLSAGLSGIGSLAAGAVTAGLAAAAAGFVALGAGMAVAVTAALENEKLQASLALTVRNANAAIEEQNAAIDDAAGKFVSSTALSAEALAKLDDKLEHATAKLHDMEAAYANNKKPTESQTLALEDQREAVAALTGEIAAGSRVITTSLGDALKLGTKQAGFTVEGMNELAKSFQDLAGGSDDAILAIETIGIRAGTISVHEMPAFIQSVLDLGTIMGDTASAATLLARAQEDPLAALGKLQRAGVIFTDSLKDQIKELVKNNDMAGATALIMDRVAEATGGAAAANAATLSGQWEILRGRFGEATETIGMALLPVLHTLFEDVIKPAIPVMEAIAEALGTFLGLVTAGNIQTAFNQLALDMGRAFGPEVGLMILGIRDAVFTTLENLKSQAGTMAVALQPLITAAQNVAAAFVESMPMIEQSVQEMAAFVVEQFEMMSPTILENVTNTLNGLATFWREHGDTIMAIVEVAWKFISVTIGVALVLISGIIANATNLINGDWDAFWATMQDTQTTAMNMILAIADTNLEEFNAVWAGNWENAKLIVITVWELMKDGVADLAMGMTSEIQQIIIDVVNWLREYVPQFVTIGRHMMLGLINGVQSMASALVESVLGPVRDAINAVRNLLDEHSPSRVFADIGANMMKGMALGVSGAAYLPAMATASATTNITNNYNINASYANAQSQGSIAQDLRLRERLKG